MTKTLYINNYKEHTISDLHELFTKNNKVLCINNYDQLENILQDNHKVLILTSGYSINIDLQEMITINTSQYKLRVVS